MAELRAPSSSSSGGGKQEKAEEEEGGVEVGVVLAGDFNSTPLSAVYHFLSTCVRPPSSFSPYVVHT